MAFLATEKENQQLEDLPQANSGRVAVFSVGKEKVNIWEFCILKITLIVFVMIRRIFQP